MTQEIKILFVDDEPNVLNAIQRLFLDEEYELLTAFTGEEGLAILAREEMVQVVVSDYRMPGMDGVEFLKEVYRQWPETIRIVLSGYADIGAIVSAVNEGQIFKFIPKPWNDDELRLAIARAVDIYTLQRQHRELMEQLTRHSQAHDQLVKEMTAELAARSTELRKVQGVLEALPGGVLVVDGARMVRSCNRTFREIFGVEGQPWSGRPLHDLLPTQVPIDAIQADGSPLTLELHGRVLEVQGRPLPSGQGEQGSAWSWLFEFWRRG